MGLLAFIFVVGGLLICIFSPTWFFDKPSSFWGVTAFLATFCAGGFLALLGGVYFDDCMNRYDKEHTEPKFDVTGKITKEQCSND